ncbi:MAG: PAS domain S-box protein [Planctomycetes bacterium]|nr:PAS domain S-box protein [Planctomycetota bacterium]
MVKKRNSGSENIEPVRESNRPRKQPNLVSAGRPQPGNSSDLNEQLRTEVEELRRQVLELRESKHWDERSIQGWEWLARIAEENPDPVLQVSQQGVIHYRNPASFALCRQWNPSDELIVPPAIHEIIKAAYASAEVIHQEMTIGDHTYLITVAPAPTPAKYVNIYASDITERKQAEEALRESEAKFRSVLDNSQDVIYRLNLLTSCFDYISPSCRTVVGYCAAELMALDAAGMRAMIHPDDLPALLAALATLEQTGTAEVEYRQRTKSGGYRWMSNRMSLTCGADGRPLYRNGNIRDITDRKRAEEALRESEERLHLALGAARMGAWQWEVGTEHVAWSPELYALLGYEPAEVTPTHQAFRDRIHPQDLARWEQTLRGSMERCEDYSCEFRVVWADGSVHWVEGRGRYAYTGTEGGMMTLWMRGVLADYEQRKQAEEALRESEERLTATLHSMQDEVWIVDAQGRVILINEAVQEHLGVAPDRWEDIYAAIAELEIFLSDGTPRPAEQAPLARALRGEVLAGVQEMVRNLATGELRWREVTSAPIRDQAGQITGAVVVARDITERKRAEETLRESEERLRFVVESSPDTIFVQDRDLRYVWMNRPAYPLTHKKLVGHTDAEMLLPEDAARLTEIKQRVLAQGQRQTAEVHLTWEGQIRFYEAIFEPWRDAAGAIIGVAGYVRDITERKQAEEELRKLTATLESKVMQRTAELRHRARQLQKLTLEMSEAEDRERKRLAAILHDDVQQIIAAAKYQLSVLRNRVRENASLAAVGEQIDQMLKEAVEKSRGLSHELSPAALYGDFAEALDQLARQIQAKHGLTVRVHASGQVRLQSNAIKAFLYRTVQELLFNAVKHAQVKEARIRVRQCGRCVCLSVSDRGRGFDPAELREAAGFGLLSIRERIELLEGRMKIRSAPGKGSTFSLVVPDSESTSPNLVHDAIRGDGVSP